MKTIREVAEFAHISPLTDLGVVRYHFAEIAVFKRGLNIFKRGSEAQLR